MPNLLPFYQITFPAQEMTFSVCKMPQSGLPNGIIGCRKHIFCRRNAVSGCRKHIIGIPKTYFRHPDRVISTNGNAFSSGRNGISTNRNVFSPVFFPILKKKKHHSRVLKRLFADIFNRFKKKSTYKTKKYTVFDNNYCHLLK